MTNKNTTKWEQVKSTTHLAFESEDLDFVSVTITGKRVSDYSGCFALPREVVALLRASGYVVPRECYELIGYRSGR